MVSANDGSAPSFIPNPESNAPKPSKGKKARGVTFVEPNKK